MNHIYFEKWSEMTKMVQGPLQEIAQLNAETLRNLSFLKPEDFSKVKQPEELMEKLLKISVDNGHKTLDHIQQSFDIIEKAMLSAVQEVKTQTERASK